MKKQLLKTFKLRVLALVALLCTGFAGQVWGESVTYSLTPDKNSTGCSETSYITTLTEFTYKGITWKMNQWNPSTLQVRTNQSSAAGEFRFYNTSAIPGKITQVVITFSALTVADASKLMFLGGTAEVTDIAGGTAGTWNETNKTLTWTPGALDNFTYFAFYQDGKAATGTNKLASENAIVVTYETSGGSTTETVASPIFNPAAGAVEAGTEVTISCATEGATIHYTLDGNDPTEESSIYSSPITINEETTIKAIAVKTDYNNSAVATAAYTITDPNLIFSETFTGTNGYTTNESDSFSGGAGAGTNVVYDNEDWTVNTPKGAGNALKVGTGSSKGNAETPALALLDGDATLTFKAAAWATEEAILTVSISGGGTVSPASFTLANQEWGTYTVSISGGTKDSKIKFEANKNRFFLDEVIIMKPAEGEKKNSGLAFPETAYSIDQGAEFTAPTATAVEGYDGNITYAISGEIGTINPATGAITFDTTKFGEATITATCTETDKYKAGTASYTLTVAKVCQSIAEFKALTSGTPSKLKLDNAQVLYVNGNDMYVKDSSGAIDFFQTGLKFETGDILNGTITGKYTLYSGLPELTDMTANTLESTENQNVEPIVLTSADDISNYECQVVSIANQSVSLNNTRYYIGNIQLYNKYYKFGTLIEGATYDVTGIAIYYKTSSVDTWEIAPRTKEDLVAHTATFTIAEACTDGDKYYGTYSNESAFAVPEDLTVSEISVDGDGILTVTDYETGDIVPANTGVMVSSTTAGEKSVVLTTAAGTAKTDNNMLKASSVAMEGNYKFYRLTMHNGNTLGFYYGAAEGAAFALGANKAYLAVPASSTGAKEGFAFGETTGINNVNVNENESGKIFNLAGQQMKSAVKGVYIKNGKKYIK